MKIQITTEVEIDIESFDNTISELMSSKEEIDTSDGRDLKKVSILLKEGRVEKAAEVYSDLDTATREYIPDDIWQLFNNLELI